MEKENASQGYNTDLNELNVFWRSTTVCAYRMEHDDDDDITQHEGEPTSFDLASACEHFVKNSPDKKKCLNNSHEHLLSADI